MKREKRLKKHIEKEHPSTRGRISLSRTKKNQRGFTTKKQIKKIKKNVPNFPAQARKFTKLKGGRK